MQLKDKADMQYALTTMRIAFRALIWKRTDGTYESSLPAMFGWGLMLVLSWIVISYTRVWSGGGTFSPYGLNALLAWLVLWLSATALFVSPGRRVAFLTVSAALTILLEIAFETFSAFSLSYLTAIVGDSWPRAIAIWLATLALYGVWWTGAIAKLLDSLQPERAPQLRRATAMWAATLVLFAAVPHYPVFVGRDFDRASANLWEFARAAFATEPAAKDTSASAEAARTELAQPFLVEAMTAQLAPERPGKTDVYMIGLAGWAAQDVFYREVTGALDSIDKSLPITGRVALLINNPKSLGDVPIANRQNFAALVRAVAQRMNREEDILFLLMTSHGTRDGLALALPGSIDATLSPEDVALVLDREGIKNRVVVVSACYAGVFIKPLANDDTIVLTAADENSTSFGCSNDREWTYFGEALFARSLRPGIDLERVFGDAKSLVGEWESAQGLTPSNPQAHFGANLLSKLAPLRVSRASNNEAPHAPEAQR